MDPKITATHYLPDKNGNIQMYYRVTKGFYNTGETYRGLEYYSSFGVWQGSNERSHEEFIKNRLAKIEGKDPFNKGRS